MKKAKQHNKKAAKKKVTVSKKQKTAPKLIPSPIVLQQIPEMQPKRHERPSWDEYFLDIKSMVAERATCDRGRSGCVIVRSKQILTTGYVGSAIGAPHCDEVGHEMNDVIHPDGTVSKHCVRTIHAELNAIVQAARLGIPLEGSTLYCKMTPCYTCGKAIVNAGIKRVVARRDYHKGDQSKKLFAQAGVEFAIVEGKMEQYPNQ